MDLYIHIYVKTNDFYQFLWWMEAPLYLLVGGLEHFLFFHILGISSSQPTNSYFSEGFKPPTSKNINNFYQFLIYPPQIHNLQCNWGCCPERSVHRFTSQPSEQWLNPLLDLLVGDSQEVIPVFYGNVNRTDSWGEFQAATIAGMLIAFVAAMAFLKLRHEHASLATVCWHPDYTLGCC